MYCEISLEPLGQVYLQTSVIVYVADYTVVSP